MNLKLLLCVFLSLLLLVTVAAAESEIDAPSNRGALQVTNDRLTDAAGQPVQLRGISTHGLSW